MSDTRFVCTYGWDGAARMLNENTLSSAKSSVERKNLPNRRGRSKPFDSEILAIGLPPVGGVEFAVRGGKTSTFLLSLHSLPAVVIQDRRLYAHALPKK